MYRTAYPLLAGLVLAASPAAAAVHRIWTADAKTAAKALLEAAPGDIVVEDVTRQKAAELFLKPSQEWCVVSRLVADGASAAAGIQEGDEILAVNDESAFGTPCPSLESALSPTGKTEVTVRYGRAGRSYETTVRLARRAWPIGDDEDRCAAAAGGTYGQPRRTLEIMAEAGLRCAMRDYAQYLGSEKREREAARWCLKAAEAGDPLSQHQAYFRLLMGQGVSADPTRAWRFLSSAAAAGYGPSLKALATYRFSGAAIFGFAADPAAARELLLAAGARGTGLYDLALNYQNGTSGFPKDEAAAFRWRVRAAWRGEGSAETAKQLYEKGVAPSDDAEALRFYAAYGERQRDLSVAWSLLSGERGMKDAERAFRIYRKRAEHEQAPRLAVGWMLVMGEGAAKDPAAAAAWFEKAKGSGYDEDAKMAENNLAWLYLNGEGVDKDENKAFALFPGAGMGAYNKGVMYEHGIWEKKDMAKAYESYRAASRSDPWSMVRMGDAHLCRPACIPGVAAVADARTAVGYYRGAAEKGHPIAQQRMGELYEKGLAVTKDLRQAAIWYKRASSYRGPDPTRNSLNPRFELRVDAERVLGGGGGAEDLASMREAAGRKAAQLMAAAAGTEAYKAHDARLKSDADQPSYRLPERAEDFAVVVGVESYPNLPPAEFAERDAKAVREHFRALGVPERNLVFLSGRDASRAGLAKNLETWLPMNVKESSTVWFYFSGHGAPDPTSGDAYLIPADGDPQFLKDTAYPLKRLYEKLGALKARRVLVALDACFSGVGERSLLAKGTRPLVARVDLGGLPANVAALSAADGHEVSGTLESQGHGLFTYYWLKGLNGAAAGTDGAITWRGLHEWLTPRVQDEARRQNRLQTPRLLGAADGLRLR